MKPLFFLLLSAVTASAQLPSYLPTSGLVASYPFTGNAQDESGNGKHGTVDGAALSTDRFGRLNSAYRFNGISDKITVNGAASFTSPALSVSVWYQTEDTTNRQYLLYHGEWEAGDLERFATGINFQLPGETVTGIKRSSGCQPGAGWKYTTVRPVNNLVWNHYVFTYNGSAARVYLNGQPAVFNPTISGEIDACDANTLTLGAGWSQDPGWLNGKLDEIAVYARALNENEVKKIYENQSQPPAGLVGINVLNPQRNLHVKDVLRLEPRHSAPDNPAEGDMYYDAVLKKLRVFDGNSWQNCW